LEDLLPESGFCWKKDHQDTMFWKIGKFQKNTRKLYFAKRLKKPEGGGERSHRAGTHTGGASPQLATSACCVAALAHFCHRPFAYFIVSKNLSQGGSEIDTAASAGWKTPEREKLTGRQKSAGEIPSRRGEIVTIDMSPTYP
jgi:hypothetical protein